MNSSYPCRNELSLARLCSPTCPKDENLFLNTNSVAIPGCFIFFFIVLPVVVLHAYKVLFYSSLS